VALRSGSVDFETNQALAKLTLGARFDLARAFARHTETPP
jgi:hypothetical protein